MYLLIVNLYELGQFLQIFLWISLPVALVAVLITTYMHYRRKSRQRKEEAGLLLAGTYDGWMSPAPGEGGEPASSGQDKTVLEAEDENTPVYNGENAYKGLIWMKDKYEEYRGQSDRKYERLKEELAKVEQKYLDLLAARPVMPVVPAAQSAGFEHSITQDNDPASQTIVTGDPASADDPVNERDRQIVLLEMRGRKNKDRIEELERQYMDVQEEMHEKEVALEGLHGQLTRETARVAELTGRLESNMRLLLNIHKEVKSSLNGTDSDLTTAGETKILGWVESDC